MNEVINAKKAHDYYNVDPVAFPNLTNREYILKIPEKLQIKGIEIDTLINRNLSLRGREEKSSTSIRSQEKLAKYLGRLTENDLLSKEYSEGFFTLFDPSKKFRIDAILYLSSFNNLPYKSDFFYIPYNNHLIERPHQDTLRFYLDRNGSEILSRKPVQNSYAKVSLISLALGNHFGTPYLNPLIYNNLNLSKYYSQIENHILNPRSKKAGILTQDKIEKILVTSNSDSILSSSLESQGVKLSEIILPNPGEYINMPGDSIHFDLKPLATKDSSFRARLLLTINIEENFYSFPTLPTLPSLESWSS